MFRNYLKTAFRNLWRYRGFSFINIMGLAVGMTAAFLIFLYVSFELGYDRFHNKSDRIYRVITDVKTPSETIKAGITSWAYGPNIKNDFAEVEAFTRVNRSDVIIKKQNDIFQEKDVFWVDSAFFQIFDFKLIKGDAATVLKDPFSVVLSRSSAKKYFGDSDPVGQTLLITGDQYPAKVTGLMEDMPANSQIKSGMLVSLSTMKQRLYPDMDEQWQNFDPVTYLLLKPGVDATSLTAKFPAFLQKHTGTEMEQSKMFCTILLEPLTSVYLGSDREGGSVESGSSSNVYIFSMIGIFILLIACINFVNLTTARSAERAKEVGIRKVVGAEKFQLLRQFLGESLIISLIAFILAVGLAALIIPLFNQLAGKTISEGIFSDYPQLSLLFAAAVLIGILAGGYPALVLSSFKPIVVLKGRFVTGNRGIVLRKSLVVIQFAISIALIIGTVVVFNQMDFMRNRQLGFNKDQMLILDTRGDASSQTLKTELERLPGVKNAALSSSVPGGFNPGAYSEIENNKGDLQIANIDLYFVDFDYMSLFEMKMVAGRQFAREYKTDSTQAMVINEAAVKLLGYNDPQQAVGRRFKQWGREGQIVGVMKNFHFRSLKEQVKPLTMRIEHDRCNLLSLNISSDHVSTIIGAVENKWKSIVPGQPFNYFFLDEFFDRQYRSEERFGKLFMYFAVLAIFISCLGLLGLASYSTTQRTKEIGIRKVMGASVANIINLLSKDFLKLVVLSFLIAAPLAGYFMYEWLKDFAFRTTISWWVFLSAGMIALLIAWFTISYQAVKAALTNPVKNLRTE